MEIRCWNPQEAFLTSLQHMLKNSSTEIVYADGVSNAPGLSAVHSLIVEGLMSSKVYLNGPLLVEVDHRDSVV